MQKHLLLLAGLVICMASAVATADDKDLLRKGSAPPNLMIIFGNSQTTAATISNVDPNATSTWDGDADSPAAKLGAAKLVVKQFVNTRHTTFNIGLTTFAHNPNAGSISISGKHWLYSPIGTAAGGLNAATFPTSPERAGRNDREMGTARARDRART